MLEILKPFAYLIFHLTVWGSLLIGKIAYPPMKIPNHKKLINAIPISIAFIIWDTLVTNRWWYFSDKYTLFKIGSLPIEEIMFFISIPIALVVITENFRAVIKSNYQKVISNRVFLLIKTIPLMILFFALFNGWEYTAIIALLTFVFTKKADLENKVFLAGLLFTLLATFFFNYYLTALPIVTYNQFLKSPWQIFSIPIEDFFYGLIFYKLIFSRYYENSDFYRTT